MCTCSPGVKGGKGINHLPPLSWLFCLYERWSKRLPGKYIQSGQEVNPSLFRSKKWTDCIQIKTALNRNSRILVISKRHANEKKVPTLWTGEIDINPQNPAVASIDFHHSTPLPTSGFAGDWWKGFVEKFHEKDWKRLDVCSYGVVLMFLLQHSAPHYFREPIVHRFESRCHNLWHLCIQIHHWISSSWEESEGIGKHTHTHTPTEAPWESERRFRSFFAQLPTAKEWTLKWYSHGTSRNVGKGSLTFYLWRQPEKASMYKVHILLFLKAFNSQDRRVRLQRRSNLQWNRCRCKSSWHLKRHDDLHWFAVSLSLRIPISCATSHLLLRFLKQLYDKPAGQKKGLCSTISLPTLSMHCCICQNSENAEDSCTDGGVSLYHAASWVASSHWVKRDKRCHPPYSQSSPETHRKRRHIQGHYSCYNCPTWDIRLSWTTSLSKSFYKLMWWNTFSLWQGNFRVAASKDHNAFPLRYVIAGKLFNLSPNLPIWSIRTRSTTKHVDAAVFGWAVFCFLPGPSFQVWWS